MSSAYYHHPHQQKVYYYSIPQHHHTIYPHPPRSIYYYHNPKQPSIAYYYNPSYDDHSYRSSNYQYQYQEQYQYQCPETLQNIPPRQRPQGPALEQTTHDLRDKLHHRRYQHALLREGLRRRLHVQDLLVLLGCTSRYSLNMGGGSIGMFFFFFFSGEVL
ncbi:hypothetical protein ASPBRDRAFT_675152, partial [Aspergillus brasiliensis CBS 101740]